MMSRIYPKGYILKVNTLKQILGREWEISPAGGATGEAFIAIHEKEKLFLKRNSSPFLAVLSAEGIVPKLVWTKRLENGDVITAQKWLSGRVLRPEEMNQERVAKLLRKIHTSAPLLNMLKKMGKSPVKPEGWLKKIEERLDEEIYSLPVVTSSLQFLRREAENVWTDLQVVCHCDVNHNNWLLGENGQLYLIDWDEAMIGDPAIDLGMLLHWYIPRNEWDDWIRLYGAELTPQLLLRMKWYVIALTLNSIQWHMDLDRLAEMDKQIRFLEENLHRS